MLSAKTVVISVCKKPRLPTAPRPDFMTDAVSFGKSILFFHFVKQRVDKLFLSLTVFHLIAYDFLSDIERE